MGLKLSFELSDRDLLYFRESLRQSREAVRDAEETEIVDAVRHVLEEIRGHRDALTVGRVFGDAYELDGMTVIPVGRVAGDETHVAHVHAQLIGHDLGEGSEMTLALGPDAAGNADPAAGLHRHLGPLVGTDAGALHVGDQAKTDIAASWQLPSMTLAMNNFTAPPPV